MKMLPVCSAATRCPSHSQIFHHGHLRQFSGNAKTWEVRCIAEDKVAFGMSDGFHLEGVSLRRQAAKSFFVDVKMPPSFQTELGDTKLNYSGNFSYSNSSINEELGHLRFMGEPSLSSQDEEVKDFTEKLFQDADVLSKPAGPETITSLDSSMLDTDSLSSTNTNAEDILGSLNKGEIGLKLSLDTITSSVKSAFDGANKAVDDAINKVTSAVDRTAKLASDKLIGFSGDLNEASSKTGIIAVDVLRRTIVSVEDSLGKGATLVLYAYGSAKELLPSEIQNVLNSSEERAMKILMPVGTSFRQVYIALEGLEKSLGLDPSDPIVQFVVFLGISATLWGSYWKLTYGGYAGDLCPKSTLELLTGEDKAVLIDVRSEDLRERDGIPDLRRAARFRYANVELPEVDGSVRKLLKTGGDFDDTLIAAVIRNLRIVQDRSKIIVMDADGSRSKGIARSLRKLGIKTPYLVRGGFQSWLKDGFRVKELKPETAFTILNEEAEAIIEDIKPTPLKVLGYGVGFIAAAFALLEWEKTLQIVGILGLSQTIYRRIGSYEDSEDFKQDVRLLLAPVRMGGQAILWAATKLETNRNGLPTSPSSQDVQNRVLQAAAKHESQPSDLEEIQDSSPPEMMIPVNENADPSEA